MQFKPCEPRSGHTRRVRLPERRSSRGYGHFGGESGSNLLELREGYPLGEVVAAQLLEVVPAERPEHLDIRSLCQKTRVARLRTRGNQALLLAKSNSRVASERGRDRAGGISRLAAEPTLAMRFLLRRSMKRLQPAMMATPTTTPITIPEISPILAPRRPVTPPPLPLPPPADLTLRPARSP